MINQVDTSYPVPSTTRWVRQGTRFYFIII